MATLIDEEQVAELELQEGEVQGDIEKDTFTSDIDEVEPAQPEETPEEATPSGKYDGKSHAEMVAILEERERMIGMQSTELGNLRSTFDAMAKTQSVPEKPEPEPQEEVDFFVDPAKAVNQQINNHPALKEAQDIAKKLAYAQGVATLQQRHPDVKEVMGSPEFAEWIKSSPARLRRFQYADQSGDVEEADDLISTFKQLNKTVATAKAAEKTAQKKAVTAAAVSGGRSNPDAASSKRIYRRADIRKLMKSDPDRYEELQPEIVQAYAEGRVRD